MNLKKNHPAITIEEPFALSPESVEGAKCRAASHLTGDAYLHQCFVSNCKALPFDRLRANGSIHGFSIDNNREALNKNYSKVHGLCADFRSKKTDNSGRTATTNPKFVGKVSVDCQRSEAISFLGRAALKLLHCVRNDETMKSSLSRIHAPYTE